MKLSTVISSLLLALVVGCGVTPLKPGKAGFTAPSGMVGSVQQPENPQGTTKQLYKRVVEEPGNRKVSEEVETILGPAQKDVARELGAKLGALKGVVWVGLLVFLFGAVSFVYPPLKAIVGGSVTTSAVISAAGLAMIVLPTLIVGNELLILAVAMGAAALYWFSHRHGRLQGFVDANRDGIDDRGQK